MRKKYRVYEYWKTGVNGKVENKFMNEPKFNKSIYRDDPFSNPSKPKNQGNLKELIVGIYLMSCAGYCTFQILKFVFLKLIA